MLKIAKQYEPNADVIFSLGDCIDLLPTIPDETVQLIVTSPPYNIGKEYEVKTSLQEYLKFQERVIAESVRIVKPGGSICWEVGNYVENGKITPLDILLFPIFSSLGLSLRNRIDPSFGSPFAQPHGKDKREGT